MAPVAEVAKARTSPAQPCVQFAAGRCAAILSLACSSAPLGTQWKTAVLSTRALQMQEFWPARQPAGHAPAAGKPDSHPTANVTGAGAAAPFQRPTFPSLSTSTWRGFATWPSEKNRCTQGAGTTS